MSRIFEALQKTSGAFDEAVMPVEVPRTAADVSVRDMAIVCRSIEPVSEQERIANEPVMPDVPEFPADGVRTIGVRLTGTNPLMPFGSGANRSAEQYRIIRTKIDQHAAKPQMLVITSAGPADGKTVTSVNVSAAMSLKAGVRILLVDGDLRRSSIAKLLGLPPQPGLTDVLTGTCSLDSALIRIEQFPNLYVLTAGTGVSSPAELLDSSRWADLCARIRREFNNIVVDSPPIAAVSDYDLIQAAVDGIIVVARPDHTRRAALKNALSKVTAKKLVGIILNNVEDWFLWDAHSGSHYHYYEPLDLAQMRRSNGAASLKSTTGR